MKVLAPYRAVFSIPGVARVVVASFTCRILAGMVNLALLLAASGATGSYAAAGSVSAAFAIALTIVAPLWGGIADRQGPRRALAWASVLQPFAFALYVLAAVAAPRPLFLAPAAFLVGAFTPPSSSVTNATFTAMIDDPDARRTLFAVEVLLTESVFIIGPLIVAGVVVVLGPIGAVVVAATISLLGTLWLRGAPLVRALNRLPIERTATRPSFVRNRQLLSVMLVIAIAAFAIGAIEVSVVAHADALSWSAGVLLAAMAAGGVVGSLLYGGLQPRGALRAQLALALGLYGGLLVLMGVTPGVVASLALLILIGFVNGPADAIEVALVAEAAPPGVRAQAFSFLVSANWIGFALGTALGGLTVQEVSVGSGIVLAGVAALAAAAVAITLRVGARDPRAELTPPSEPSGI